MLEQSCYTDRVVESAWLNRLLVSTNNLYAFMFRNVINAPLMSKKSMRIKQELEGEADAGVGKNAEAKLRQQQQHHISDIPQKNKFLFNVQFLVQVLLVLRFMAVCVYLSTYHPYKRALVSYARPPGSMFYESLKFSLPVRVMMLPGPPLPGERSANDSFSYTGPYMRSYNALVPASERQCAADLDRFYTDKYGQFYVWNASISINTNDQAKYFLLEQHPALQMLRKEVIIYNYLLGFMIATCGIFGCWLAARSPFDFMPLVFVYEPQFVAAYTQRRLQNYLRVVHKSYKNFWSAYTLDWKNELTYHAHSCWNCSHVHIYESQEEDEQTDSLQGDDVRRGSFESRLDEREFRSYMPTARGQAWRRWLIILHPVTQIQETLTLFASIFSLCLLFVYKNDVETNFNLSAFLAGDTQTQSTACNLDPELGNSTLRQSIQANFARGLNENREFTSDRLAPIDFPPASHWIAIATILILSCQVISLYLTLLIITITDLCFWLVELRLKLNICISLLRHRRDEHGEREDAKSLFEEHLSTFSGAGGEGNNRFYRLHSSGIASRRFFSARLKQSMRRDHDPRRELARASESRDAKREQTKLCNINLSCLGNYLMANRAKKDIICNRYAQQLVTVDSTSTCQQAADKFLLATYLDLRLFLDQIDDCRTSMNIIIGFCVFHELNIIGGSTNLNDIKSKFGFVMGAFALGNVGLLAAAFFQSQCSKLYRPIHSMLALCVRGDKTTRHLALLWRRSLVDFTGPKSKFSFTIYSIKISYASVLQFNLSLISLYILILDKNKTELH